MNLDINLICDDVQLKKALIANFQNFLEYRINYSNTSNAVTIILESATASKPPQGSWTIRWGFNNDFYSYDNDTKSHIFNASVDGIEDAYKYILVCNIINGESPIIYSRHQLAQHPMCKLVPE